MLALDGEGEFDHFDGIIEELAKPRASRDPSSTMGLVESFLEGLPNPAFVKDEKHRWVLLNAAFCDLMGYERGELIGKSDLDFYPPQEARAFWATDDEVFAEAGVKENEEHFTDASGRVRTIITRKTLHTDGHGGRLLLGVITDITDRKRADESLRESEERFRIAFQTSPDWVDISRFNDGVYLAVNEGFLESTGWSEVEVLGRSSLDIKLWDDPASRDRIVETVGRQGYAENVEVRFRAKNGRLVLGLVSARPIQIDGESVLLSMTRDMGDWKRALDEIRESETRLRAFVESDVIGILFGDVDGRVYDCNRELARIIGRSHEDVLAGKVSWVDITPPEDLPIDEAALAEAAATGRCRPYEKHYLRPDSTLVPVQVGYVLLEPDRHKSVAFILDITNRTRVEEALRESQATLDLALRSAQMGTWQWDVVADRRRFDDQSCRLLGLSPATFSGSAAEFFAVVHPDDREKLREAAARAIEEGAPYDPEYRTVWPDGSIHYVCARGGIARDPAGRPLRLDGIVWDISERRWAEEALRRSEAFFRSVLQISTDFWSVLDSEGRYKYLSSGSSSVVGWTEQELLGQAATERVHPGDLDRVRASLADVFAAPGRIGRVTYRYRHRDGSWRVLDTMARNLFHDPNVRGVVVNRRDVTDQRHAEEQFQQSQKLESVGRLAGGIAHDFNNLLTIIQSCSESLKDDVAAGLPAQGDLIDEIHAAGKRAAELTRQLLAFARKQEIAPVTLDLNTVVRGTERLLRRVLGEDVELLVDARALWNVRCDPGQVEQVILNLAVNARDAMPGGGRFVIATSNVHVDSDSDQAAQFPVEHPGDFVMLVLRDSGTGMSPEVKEHAFEPFFTTKPQGAGTGLGLATVYGIVKQSGGHINLTSELGEGTVFQIFFPRTLDTVVAGVPSPSSTTTGGTESILVVEDDPGVREVTVRSLRAAGYRVLIAASGRDALHMDLGELRQVHLVVTDVIMPGLDGPSMVKQLVQRCSNLRVLYVSGYTQDALAERSVLGPGFEFLHKPFTPSSLLTRVRAVLDLP